MILGKAKHGRCCFLGNSIILEQEKLYKWRNTLTSNVCVYSCRSDGPNKDERHVASSSSTVLSRRQLCLTLFSMTAVSLILPFEPSPSLGEIDTSDMIFTRTSSGLEYYDFRVGNGPKPIEGTTCFLRWTGRLADRFGWPFEQQGMLGDELLQIVLGRDHIIEGLREGLITMRCGGKRRLYIPAKLGYTDETIGPQPRKFGNRRRLYATVLNKRRVKNAGDLLLDIELVKCKPANQ